MVGSQSWTESSGPNLVERIHPTAVVDPGAKIADDVRIGPYAVIGEGVELAAGVEIASHVHLEGSHCDRRGDPRVSVRGDRRGAPGSRLFGADCDVGDRARQRDSRVRSDPRRHASTEAVARGLATTT